MGRRRMNNQDVAAAIFGYILHVAVEQLTEFGRLEQTAIEEMENILIARDEGSPDDALADSVEQRVLPVWADCRKRIDVLMDAPSLDQEYLSQLAEYVDIRSRSCRVFAEGLREGDEQKIEQFHRLYASADELAGKLGAEEE